MRRILISDFELINSNIGQAQYMRNALKLGGFRMKKRSSFTNDNIDNVFEEIESPKAAWRDDKLHAIVVEQGDIDR
jgi:hypothetical protein